MDSGKELAPCDHSHNQKKDEKQEPFDLAIGWGSRTWATCSSLTSCRQCRAGNAGSLGNFHGGDEGDAFGIGECEETALTVVRISFTRRDSIKRQNGTNKWGNNARLFISIWKSNKVWQQSIRYSKLYPSLKYKCLPSTELSKNPKIVI